MKLLWIAHEGHKSGANNVLLDYATLLKEKGHEITVVISSRGNMEQECIKRGFIIKHFYYATIAYSGKFQIYYWVKRRLRNTVTLLKILPFVKKEAPDLVITNSIVNSSIFAIAAKILKIRHIWFILEFGNKDHGLSFDWGYSIHLKIINFLSERIVTVANAVKQHLAIFVEEKNIDVVLNRVMVPTKYLGKHETIDYPQLFTVLHLAQIGEGKNQLEGIKAIHLLHKQGIKLKLEVAGAVLNEFYYKELKNYVEENGLQEVVEFSGFTNQHYQKLQNADVVILCSRCEACALTIFETLQIGTPMILSNTGGNPEIIVDESIGLLYTFNKEETLAEKIKLLYNSPVLRKQISENAKKYSIENYSLPKSVEEFGKFL